MLHFQSRLEFYRELLKGEWSEEGLAYILRVLEEEKRKTGVPGDLRRFFVAPTERVG